MNTKSCGLCASLTVLSLFIACTMAMADDRQFEVEEWCFCRSIGVDKKGPIPIDRLSDPAEAKGNDKLHLWMRISVNANGIKYLRQLNKLPVYHAWGRNGWVEGRTIDIGLDARKWQGEKKAIEDEIRLRNGTFDWRTYSEKVYYIYDGEHYVSVLDANRRPVVLSRDRYTAFRPSIHIKVKEN